MVRSCFCFVDKAHQSVVKRIIGKYEIIERLGRGGMAEVYRGYHASLDRYVAIKVLHTFLADDPEFKSRFEKEAQSVARLKHPHIVQVYDFDHDTKNDSFYMVMELIEGPTLKDLLFELATNGARLPFGEALRIIAQAASALAYAHNNSMIHRDVKPANLMLDQGKRVVLTDFGIAKILTAQQHTATGGLVGTPAYMAPEQGMGETGDERSDLYSLGVILFELFTGQLPYGAETPVAMIMKHVHDPIPSAVEINPHLPDGVDAIIARMLAKAPDDRYQSVEEFVADLRRLRSGKTPGAEVSITRTKPVDLEQQEDLIKTYLPKSRVVDTATIKLPPPAKGDGEGTQSHKSISRWAWLVGILIAVIIGVLGGMWVSTGKIPLIALLPNDSPTPTFTLSPTWTYTPTPTDGSTEAIVVPLATDTPTHTVAPTLTATHVPTATNTPTVTLTPTDTPTATWTFTPSITPNMTATIGVIQTATVAACSFDYLIVEQNPANGFEGGYFVTNAEYERKITLRNTGTCSWDPNTALTFLTGENFNIGPRIFIREQVEPGGEVTIDFKGQLPPLGGIDPLQGTWELRTPGQIPIGEPLVISILVYSGG